MKDQIMMKIGSSNNSELLLILHELPCIDSATLSNDNHTIEVVWKAAYHNEFDSEPENELMEMLYKNKWLHGIDDEARTGNKYWWFEEDITNYDRE